MALQGRTLDVDAAWTEALRSEHLRRSARYAEALGSAPAGKDGYMHPNRIFAALCGRPRPRRHHRSPTGETS